MKTCYLILFILLFYSIIGCNETMDPYSNPDSFVEEMLSVYSDTDSMTGKITRIESWQFGTRILVEENVKVHKPLEDGGKKTWYGIYEKTELFKHNGNNSLVKISENDLKKGQFVIAWSTGIHLSSYPSQTGAKRVIVFK